MQGEEGKVIKVNNGKSFLLDKKQEK